MEQKVFIGLGSNLADPRAQVLRAMSELDAVPQMRVLKRSSLYCSAPVGYLNQPDFINAVVLVTTDLSPRTVLDALLALEQKYGRVREFANSPRTLDLDVLLYGDLQHYEHGLTIPHPQMHLRAFVLQPLLEIAPDCLIPGIDMAAALLENCSGQSLERLVDASR